MKKLIQKAIRGLGYDLRKVPSKGDDEALYRRHFPAESIAHKHFYNVGAGGFSHPFWTNVDYHSDWYEHYRDTIGKGIQYDLLALEPLPMETETAEVVYTSHTIEHITNEAAANFFQEAFRVLKKGGTLRITTPNIDLDYRAYRRGDRDHFYWIERYSIPRHYQRARYNKPLCEASIEQIFLSHFAAAVSTLHADGAPERIHDDEFRKLLEELPYEEALDYCTARCPLEVQRKYPGNHLNWWNAPKLLRFLKEAGFSEPRVCGYGQSSCAVLRDVTSFDNTHPKISLYVEATKEPEAMERRSGDGPRPQPPVSKPG